MIVGVLLAAGRSARMGSPKQLLRKRGASFVAQGVRHLWATCDVVVVVLGSKGATIRTSIEDEFTKLVEKGALHEDLQNAHRHGADGLEVRFLDNPDWRDGMYSSVRVGLKEAVRAKPESVLVLPVDHPDVKPMTVQALTLMMRAAIQSSPPKERKQFSYALVPRHRRVRGHPVVLSPALAAAIAKDRAAAHLSDAIRRNASLVGYLDVADRGVVHNVNLPGD
jgi:molybdenum cofactor cytidylyltransferase